jgi:hypothetical protein
MSPSLTLPVGAAIVAVGCLLVSAGLAGLRHLRGQWPACAVLVAAGGVVIGGAVDWLDESQNERVVAAMRADPPDVVVPIAIRGPVPRFGMGMCPVPVLRRDDGQPVP